MNYRVNKYYHIVFWDHTIDGTDPVKCVLIGKVVKQSKVSVTFVTWDILDEPDEVREKNWTVYAIVKSAVIKRTLLKI